MSPAMASRARSFDIVGDYRLPRRALAGCLLLLSWLQHRRVAALALWGTGFIPPPRDDTYHRPPEHDTRFWSIIVGNALLATAYGVLWNGARKFDGKNVSILWHW